MVDNFFMTSKPYISILSILLVLCIILSACNLPASNPTAQPSPTSALLPSPTPTQSEPVVIEKTPAGDARFAQADLALAFGDYVEALKLYNSAPPSNTEDFRAAALYGQGLTHYKSGDLYQARRSFDQLMERYPKSPSGIRANFLLGMISAEEKKLDDAIHFYKTYIDAQPNILLAEVWTRIGDAYTALNNNEEALQAYLSAWHAPSLGTSTNLGMKVANAYTLTGQKEKALETYKEIYNSTDNIYTKSAINLLSGRIEIAQGNTAEGYAYFQDSVNNFPTTYDAFSALITLIDAGETVSELQRGIINYHRDQHNLALEALNRYLEGDGLQKDVALYYKALATRAYGLTQASLASEQRVNANRSGGTSWDKEAIALWKEIIDDHPQSVHHFDSIEAIINTQNTYMGQIRLAIETAISYASMPNGEAYAPSLYYSAGTYYLLDNQIQKAADTWATIGIAYPYATQAFNGLFFGGALYYMLEQYEDALDSFNRALLIAEVPLEVAGAELWLGKTKMALGQMANAKLDWQTAVDADPYGYYGIRAKELFDGKEPFTESGSYDLDINLDDERILAGDWLKHAFSLPPDINLDYSSALANDARYQRGIEYNKLGLFDKANLEFESLRQENAEDPLTTFRLMKLFLDNYYYKSAIECARSLRHLAGYGESPIARILPPYLAYVEYGAYYLPWVEAKAEKYNLSPLLLLSVIHQESRFGTQAVSTAGARGLMQLMPATADQIASETGFLSDFSADDLDVPFYNIELGTNYLARQLFVFEGDSYLALAAYNAGPGSVMRWQALSENNDQDLFLSTIRFLETRVYVRRIVEIHNLYRMIYAK